MQDKNGKEIEAGMVVEISGPLGLERIRDEALETAIEMAITIASIKAYQCSIKLSAIMARFVEDL